MKKISVLMVLILLSLSLGHAFAQTDTDEVDTSDWVLVEGEETYLFAPDGWIDANDPETLSTMMDTLAETNPQFENMVTLMMPQIESGLFDILLLEPVTGASMNVIVQDIGVAIALDELEPVLEAQYDQVGADIVSIETVETPVGEALQIHLELPITDVTGRQLINEQYQYALIDDTTLYIITLAANQDFFEEFDPVFLLMVDSFGIGTAPADLEPPQAEKTKSN